MTSSLLRHLPPLEGESLYGYGVRLARMNHYESFKDVLAVAGPPCDSKDPQKLMRTLHANVEAQERLAAVAKQPAPAVKRLAYTPIVCGRTDLVRFGGSAVPSDVLDVGHTRVCPECIETGPHRQLWDITLYTACHEHGWCLIDGCGDCNRYFDRNIDFKAFCAHCGNDPVQARQKASEGEIAMSREVARLAAIPGRVNTRPEALPLVKFLDCARLMIWTLAPTERRRPIYQMIENLPDPAQTIEAVWGFLQSEASFRQSLADYLASRASVAPALAKDHLLNRMEDAITTAQLEPLASWYSNRGNLPKGRPIAILEMLARMEVVNCERAAKILGLDRARLFCLSRQFPEIRTTPDGRRLSTFSLESLDSFMAKLYSKVQVKAVTYPLQALASCEISTFRKDGSMMSIVEAVLVRHLPLFKRPSPGAWGMKELFVPDLPTKIFRKLIGRQAASLKRGGYKFDRQGTLVMASAPD